MLKKVTIINSSKRKKNTYGILLKITNTLKKYDIDTEIINLFDYDIKECLGCELCLKKGSCCINDDMNLIMNKLVNSDGIILSTPIYISNVSGKIKTFLDRTCKWVHRPELTGKPVLLVATTASSDLKFTLNYLEKAAILWGLYPTGKIGRTIKNINNNLSVKEYQNFINHLYKDKIKYKPSLKQLIYFEVQKVLALKVLPIDYKYWSSKGWDKKLYYYNCKINIIKKFISKLFYNILYSKIKKVS